MDETNPKTWRATLTPHRSLSREGFRDPDVGHRGIQFRRRLVFLCHRGLAGCGFHGARCGAHLVGLPAQISPMPGGPSILKSPPMNLSSRRLAEGRPAQEQRFARRWVRVELRGRQGAGADRPALPALSRKTHGNRQFPGGPGAAFLRQRPESGADKSAFLSKKRVVPGPGRH